MAKLDFSISGKVRMLDVQADLAGDVSAAFENYSHERSLNHSIAYAKSCRSDFTKEMIKGLYQHLESFSPFRRDENGAGR